MSESISRRGVMAGAAAIAGVTALPQFLRQRRSVIGHVVVDERLSHSAAFAAGLGSPRLHRIGALDDLCNRWYTQLRREILASAGPIAGLTTWMDYVVMRSCAAEVGFERAFHAEHIPGAATLEHRITAHQDLLPQLTGLVEPDLWARAVGAALSSGAHLRSRRLPGQIFSAVTAATASHMRMVSWVFAPKD